MGIESGNMWFNTNGGYKFYVSGVTASTFAASGAYTQVSDERPKINIEPLADALEKINSLNPVTYQWKDKARGTQTEVGLIAQNVQKVYPELVKENGNFMSLNYSGLASPIIKAIKELYAMLVRLTSDILALKNGS